MSGGRRQRREELVRFLRSVQKPGRPIEGIGDHDRLVGVGLIDSLALLQIVTYLENNYDIDFSILGVDPEQLGSIASILDLIEREAA